VIITCLLEAEVVSSLRNTIHVGGVDSKVHTNRVSLNDRRGRFLFFLGLFLFLLLLFGGISVMRGTVVGTQILGIIVEVIIVINNDGLVSIYVLDNSEWIELNFVRYLILSTNKNTIVENLYEILHMLLDLDLIPVNTDTSVRNGEAFFLVTGLDLDLHDTVLEHGQMEIKVRGTEFHGV